MDIISMNGQWMTTPVWLLNLFDCHEDDKVMRGRSVVNDQ